MEFQRTSFEFLNVRQEGLVLLLTRSFSLHLLLSFVGENSQIMQASLCFIQCVLVFKMFGLALGLVVTSHPQEDTAILDRQLMDKTAILELMDKTAILDGQVMDKRAIHGGQLLDKMDQLVGISRPLHNKEAIRGEQMVTHPGSWRQEDKIHDEPMLVKIVRRRRGLGYKMHCVPTAKKVCKIIKFREKDTHFCTKVVSEKCYAIDKKNKW